MTTEEELLQDIKFMLGCGNEAQAIRLIEQYGFYKEGGYKQLNMHVVVKPLPIYDDSILKLNELCDNYYDDNQADLENDFRFGFRAGATWWAEKMNE